MDPKIKEKIENLLDDFIDVPNYSYFTNYELKIEGVDCYNLLVEKLYELINHHKSK